MIGSGLVPTMCENKDMCEILMVTQIAMLRAIQGKSIDEIVEYMENSYFPLQPSKWLDKIKDIDPNKLADKLKEAEQDKDKI